MTTAGRRPSRFDRLGIWIGLPLLALVLMGLLFGALPEGACDESGDGDAAAYVLLGFGIAVSAACLIGAVQRLVRLARRPGGIASRQLLLAVVVVAILLVLAATLRLGGDSSAFYWQAWLVTVPATGLALLILAVAALFRRESDDVGLLLPGYLAGAGLFVFPSLALLGGLIKSGGLCG
jgi:hypothetical protein